MNECITIVIADDHPIFRKGLMDVVMADGRFDVVGEAENGAKAWAMLQERLPDIALLDIDMPGISGLELATRIVNDKMRTSVVILTSYKDESLFNSAMDRGVKGYVLKENAVNDVLNALVSVSNRETFLSPSISSYLLNRVRRLEALRSNEAGIEKLTPMELRVLRLVAENKTSKEIAKQLFISPRTVDTHRNNICGKLDLRGSRGLLIFALEHKEELRGLKLFHEGLR